MSDSRTGTTRGTFRAMVERGAPADELSSMLDELSTERRVAEVLAVRGTLIRRMYSLVGGGPPLSLEDMVPASTPAGATITYEGRNSLPMFSRFRKRFTRTADGLVFGYNDQPTPGVGRLTGPGYFIVTEADAAHAGELLFDYTKPPPFEPAGWPAFRPNDRGLSRLVFMDLQDYVRQVARGVVVGIAFKQGKDQDACFSLTRAF